MLALAGLIIAFALVVGGVAMLSVPFALVVAGALVGAAVLLVDDSTFKRGGS